MHNVDGITVHLNSELAEILSILDKEVEKKIVLVIDEKQRLHGTITDGDVRRALLNGASTKSLASDVMFKDFKVVWLVFIYLMNLNKVNEKKHL